MLGEGRQEVRSREERVHPVRECTLKLCSPDTLYACHSLMSRAERDVLAGQKALACDWDTWGDC